MRRRRLRKINRGRRTGLRSHRMPKWKESNPDIVRQIVTSGEQYISGQVTLATSADQRASVLGGIFTAAGTGVIGGLIAAVASGNVSPAIVAGALLSSGLFLVGSALCLSTALPADFYLPGTRPANWYEDLAEGRELSEALGEYAENCQDKIENNSRTLAKNARRFFWGANLGIGAPFVGLIAWYLLSAHCPFT